MYVVRKRGGRDNLKTPIECQQGFSVTITIEIYRVSFPTNFSLGWGGGGLVGVGRQSTFKNTIYRPDSFGSAIGGSSSKLDSALLNSTVH
jgi:hypothetical protein